jgi:hypothetical protein
MHRTTLKTHRALLVAAALALTTSGALAQAAGGIPGSSSDGALPMPGIDLSGTKQVDPATAEKRREIEQQYRAATRRIPAQAAPTANDPWAGMRGDDNKAAAKPGKTTAKNASKKKAVAQ